jgi:hypothetical protein
LLLQVFWTCYLSCTEAMRCTVCTAFSTFSGKWSEGGFPILLPWRRHFVTRLAVKPLSRCQDTFYSAFVWTGHVAYSWLRSGWLNVSLLWILIFQNPPSFLDSATECLIVVNIHISKSIVVFGRLIVMNIDLYKLKVMFHCYEYWFCETQSFFNNAYGGTDLDVHILQIMINVAEVRYRLSIAQ